MLQFLRFQMDSSDIRLADGTIGNFNEGFSRTPFYHSVFTLGPIFYHILVIFEGKLLQIVNLLSHVVLSAPIDMLSVVQA